MAFAFTFPDVGEGIHEGEIVKWKVKEGDTVKKDQIVAEVETDKAIVELPAPESGIILKRYLKEGEIVKVGQTLLVIGKKGEKIPTFTEEKNSQLKKSNTVMGVLEEAGQETTFKVKTESKPLALLVVKALARKLNVDITKIKGTGSQGGITAEDVKNATLGTTKEESKTAKVTKKYDMYGYVERIPLTGIRKTIANKLTTTFPQAHVTHMDEADVTHLLTLKEQAKNKKTHLTLAPFIIKATILALKKHPHLNATFNGEELIVKKYYNIGIATDTPDGLMVPVLKIADQKTLVQIAEELKTLIEHAKKRKIDLADLQGSSFSITNIGSIGGTYFTPIMNPGDVAILGLGRRTEKALVLNRKIEIRNILPLSVTFDHRILDGAEVARFVNDFKQFLENPETLFR